MAKEKNGPKTAKTISSAFGAENRERIIDEYFSEKAASSIEPSQAWEHVYQLLLWVDQTTGLGHCYESDKSQPGKVWYARSLAFHKWISDSLKSTPNEVATKIDWLFIRAAEDLAAYVLKNSTKLAEKAVKQREPYKDSAFPKPGENPELVAIIKTTLGEHLADPPEELWNQLVQKVRQYFALDNKRKNLVGEGFEDVLSQIVKRACRREGLEVHTRSLLRKLRGFENFRMGEKQIKVDLAILKPNMRTIVTVKWSVRADRERQFTSDFADYLKAESSGQPFEYVFVTNEFDPARLMRACEQLNGNTHLFAHVVHINTEAIKATYQPPALDKEKAKDVAKKKVTTNKSRGDSKSEESSMQKVLQFIESGRLISLEQWLKNLEAEN
ncbi:MAG: hypothetical protein QM719_06805 [Thermomonas sp.]